MSLNKKKRTKRIEDSEPLKKKRKTKTKEKEIEPEKELFITNFRKKSTLTNFFSNEMKKVYFHLKNNQLEEAIQALKTISELHMKANELEQYTTTLMNLYRMNKKSKISQMEFIYQVLRSTRTYNFSGDFIIECFTFFKQYNEIEKFYRLYDVLKKSKREKELSECYGLCNFYLWSKKIENDSQFIEKTHDFLSLAFQYSQNFLFYHLKIKMYEVSNETEKIVTLYEELNQKGNLEGMIEYLHFLKINTINNDEKIETICMKILKTDPVNKIAFQYLFEIKEDSIIEMCPLIWNGLEASPQDEYLWTMYSKYISVLKENSDYLSNLIKNKTMMDFFDNLCYQMHEGSITDNREIFKLKKISLLDIKKLKK